MAGAFACLARRRALSTLRAWHVFGRHYCDAPNRLGGGAKLTITDNCARKLRQIATPQEMLRVFVDSGGCSGFEYKFDLVTSVHPNDDVVFERDGRAVVVDKVSLQFLDGAMIDFHEELIRSAFRVVKNPNADKGCSCGSSFSLKDNDDQSQAENK